jgi:hypothetical protein
LTGSLAAGLLALAACSSGGGSRGPERELPETMTVTSPAFPPQAAIPVRFTCSGEQVSPPLSWSKVPAGTAELALVVDDPDAPGGSYVHWVVAHLDPKQGGLPEGSLPAGAVQLRNSAGKAAWAGPCPPKAPPTTTGSRSTRSPGGSRSRPTPSPPTRSPPSSMPPPPAAAWSAPSRGEERLTPLRSSASMA